MKHRTKVTAETEIKPEMLTINQLSARGILPEKTIRKLIASGQLPCVKAGNRSYVNYQVFLDVLDSKR